ncbi:MULTISPECIES: glycine betaine ABC transporter substrate-binding protein [unclassified Sporosarcina]|uniref:glycine betaine ABC transporter substrate-binding protein n=1 Tax=unclassified Sporosarcina TaxID=2647733 RepID=UPI00203C4236|nr:MULTISPECIES: glycine betaine ABC transporter substrate-binding protein [unclassified Sporosarcina]GKV67393.1 glycine betaine-binding protein OpuAC [Sporosarcina sp. NCCP-2331]GLB57749.1 glycine betaine-binding protein OpuAC [Sporosarcina sp. NCCP-2378]
MSFKKKFLGFSSVALLAVGLAACGGDKDEDTSKTDGDGDKAASTESIGKAVDYKITGIDPGAGIMEATDRALEDYNLEKWDVTTGSGAAMTAALKKAYDKEEPIIVTGWSPHWKFAKYDLKYLDDPEGSYGGAEEIHTIGRLGLEEDLPEAYQVLSNFHWTEEDMAEIMVEIIDGEDPKVAAQNWIDANEDKVSEWTDGVEKVDGDKIKFVYVAWDSTVASTNMIANVLEDLGYKVEMSQVEAGPMYTAVADGSADVLLAGWLPITHATYMEKFGDKLDDMGVSMEDVKIGLVVPTYMDIDSIEDLKE